MAKTATRSACVLGAAVVCALSGAGVARAVVADGYASVRQVLCSTTNAGVDVYYTNAYGNSTKRENVVLRGRNIGGGRNCINLDTSTGEYGGFVGTSIAGSNGGYVYCAVFVDGRKVAESEDNSTGFSYASC